MVGDVVHNKRRENLNRGFLRPVFAGPQSPRIEKRAAWRQRVGWSLVDAAAGWYT